MKPRKAKALARKGKQVRQVGALPYRKRPSGEVEFLLITSRETRRFVFPKGWEMKGLPNHRAAALEAEQEAGIRGGAERKPFGTYRYWKRLKSAFVPVTVEVFPVLVAEELDTWREDSERLREWVNWKQARALIDEPELISLLDEFVRWRGGDG
jgi:8-oxo-dGTP pyrophosphatase MutT (NUDIX family)